MLRAIDKWGVGYLQSVLRSPKCVSGTRHLMFCVADHFEPYRGGASDAVALERIKPWCDDYMKAVDGFRDAEDRTPRHTFFYPQEEYNAKTLDMLGDLCRKGAGEVEIHLHHRNDTPDGLAEKLVAFRDVLHERHGMLGVGASRPSFGFVHGNWALCNSRPDGDWCGVNEELSVLSKAGCYADFTFPSAPSPTQPRMVNAIYRASDKSGMPRGCDKGERVRVRGEFTDGKRGELMLITGPLGLNWKKRKCGVVPRLENAEVTGANPASADRVDLWAKQGIHLEGRPDWTFVKTHTHGCVAENAAAFLQPRHVTGNTKHGGAALHSELQRYNDGVNWKLHYVSAREMYNIVRAGEDGKTGNPGDYRNYEVEVPPAATP